MTKDAIKPGMRVLIRRGVGSVYWDEHEVIDFDGWGAWVVRNVATGKEQTRNGRCFRKIE